MARKAKKAAIAPTPAAGPWSKPWLIAAAIVLLVVLAFAPALSNGFVSWDDQKNFLENPHYRGLGLDQLRWMWTTFHLGHYVPLSWMTLGLDYLAWGMNPAGYHATSIAIHAANAVLVYVLARRLLRLAVPAAAERHSRTIEYAAAFGALLFAVHPLRVESVVWVTERRDVLSLFFYLASILAFLRFVTRESKHLRWYVASVLLFLCALLSKATAMTLPAVLLVLDVYPLRRLGGETWRSWMSPAARRVYSELVPFALLSTASIVLSIVALHPPPQLPLPAKAAVSAFSLCFYVWKTLLPTGLSPLYEMPQHVDPVAPVYLVSYAIAIALTIGALAVRKRWPAVTAAWLAFLIITLPMLGVVQNGPQIAADRYTYHAGPSLAILAGALLFLVATGSDGVRAGFAALVVIALGVGTWKQSKVWHDSERLWSRVLELDPKSSVGHSAYASLLFKQDKVDEALEHSRLAVSLAPDFAEAHNDLGVGLARKGLIADAIAEYRRSLALKPTYDEAENNWGIAAVQQGNLEEAVQHYTRALELNPDYADARVNLGNVLVRMNKPDDAIRQYAEALRIRPDHADAHLNWGVALAQQGRFAEAIEHFRSALAIDPNHAEARQYLQRATELLSKPPQPPTTRPN